MDKSLKIDQCFSLQDENIQLLVSPNPGLKFMRDTWGAVASELVFVGGRALKKHACMNRGDLIV